MGLGHVGTSAMPFQVGALIDGTGVTASQAGLFGLFEVGALALSMILIAPWINNTWPAMVALTGACLALVGNVGLLTLSGFPVQLLLALIAGAGFGLVFAATIAGGVGAAEPDRFYGIGNSAALLIVFGVISAIPFAREIFGVRGIFGAMACLAALCAPCFFGFRPRGKGERLATSVVGVPGAKGLLFCWVSFSLGTGGSYAFSERIGHGLNLPESAIALVLSAGLFCGLIGAGTAVVLGTRLNRKLALNLGIYGAALSCLVLGYAPNLSIFTAAVFGYWIFTMFLYSYMLGTAAKIDLSGRLGALGGGMERLGYAGGVWLAGILAEHVSLASTGLLGFFVCLTGVVIGLPSVFRILDKASGFPEHLN